MGAGTAFGRALRDITLGAILVVAPIGLSTSTATAAEGDYCEFDTDLPGIVAADGTTCNSDASFDLTTIGKQCGATGTYYNGSMCVADNASCEPSVGQSGVYNKGNCLVEYDPPTAPTPTQPVGFTRDTDAGTSPGGELQPMCVNASPFIGGGMFVVTGTVLCYEGAGRPTGMFAYTDGGSGNGWNPFDRDSWDSLMVTRDVFAGDDITALGNITAYGGAQLYSSNGQNGVQVNDSHVLIRSSNAAGQVAAISTKPGDIDIAAQDGTWAAGIKVVANDATGDEIGRVTTAATNGTATASTVVDAEGSVSIVATDGTTASGIVVDGAEGIRIDGRIGATSTDGVGTTITGSGQGNKATPTSGPAGWADVMIGSKSYALDGLIGAGVQVSDYGVVVRSASIGNSYNEFGSAAGTQPGAIVTNVIGAGGQGTVNNRIGTAGAAGSTVLNEIGTGNNGGATTNLIGNTNAGTRIGATAGTSSMTIIQGALDLGTGQGASILTGATQQVAGGQSTVMLGSSSRHVVVDANGRMTAIDGVASQATASMYIVNGHGTTNGVVVTETATVMSGGQNNPSSDKSPHWVGYLVATALGLLGG